MTFVRDAFGRGAAKLFWLVSVPELQASGPGDDHRREHLVKHYTFWNDPDNIGSIDEIARDSLSPEHWPDNWETMNTRQFLNRLRDTTKQIQLGPEVKYDYLDGLKDTGCMKVLRSNYEIAEAAGQLSNCARTYAKDVKSKRCILAVMTNSLKKIVAMGSHPLSGEWASYGWSEIREANNRRASEATVKHFCDYSKTFRRWHRSV
jgi:hypothetical protein